MTVLVTLDYAGLDRHTYLGPKTVLTGGVCYTTEMRLSARGGAAALVIAASLSACSSSSSKPAAASKPTTPPRSVPASFGELAARIITKVPAGFVLQPDNVDDTGPSDLAKAIRDDGSPDAGKILRAEGFVRGYQQLWIDAQGAQIIVFLYQFRSPNGARQDYARAIRGYDTKSPPSAYRFTLPGLPRSHAIGACNRHGCSGSLIYFTTDVFSVQIVCSGPKATSPLQARVTSIAVDQFSRL